jgi:hypothetical protein
MEPSEAYRGRRLPRRALRSRRTLESYLRAAVLPRYMQRLREIHDELAFHSLRLEDAYRQLARACGDDRLLFEHRWRSIASEWDFRYVNELIHQHNDYYPIEADLPVDLRTGEYVTYAGRPYRREPVGPEWILERFPPAGPDAQGA